MQLSTFNNSIRILKSVILISVSLVLKLTFRVRNRIHDKNTTVKTTQGKYHLQKLLSNSVITELKS